MKIWTCKIGEVDEVAPGSDSPMRQAVREAYLQITGEEPLFLFSGWRGKLTEVEREVAEGS